MAAYVPREIDFADTAPVRIEGEVVSDVEPGAVWSVLVDHRRWPDWFGDPLVGCEPTSADETGVGSTRRVTLRPNMRFDERFIAWEPDRLWAFTVTSGPPGIRSIVERCTIHVEGPGRTRVTYRMAVDPKPIMKPFMPLLRAGIGRSLTKAMQSLAEEAKSRDGRSGD